LLDIIEGQMKGRPKGGSRRMQMLHMFAKDGYLALKRAAEDF